MYLLQLCAEIYNSSSKISPFMVTNPAATTRDEKIFETEVTCNSAFPLTQTCTAVYNFIFSRRFENT